MRRDYYGVLYCTGSGSNCDFVAARILDSRKNNSKKSHLIMYVFRKTEKAFKATISDLKHIFKRSKNHE